MNKEYVQQYAKLETTHWWFVIRQKIILQFLQKYIERKPLRILNIGAAGGASTKWLSGLGDVVSVETEPLFIDHLQKQEIRVVHASVASMPFEDNSFDLVCAFDVIEHVADELAAMKEMERVCKPGGTICITVPALMALWSEHDIVNGHQRRYTKRSLFSLAEKFPSLSNGTVYYFNSLLFLPIFIARKFTNLFSKNSKAVQSDFTRYKTPGVFNKVFKFIFSAEVPLLKFIHFPVGVSLIAAWKKEAESKG